MGAAVPGHHLLGVLAASRQLTASAAVMEQVQNIWVPLFLGIMFGVLALVAMVTTVLLILRHVRSGSAFLFLLWIWTALWFFTGPGG